MDTAKPFVLAVYGLIKNKDGTYLFLKRSKKDKHLPGYWELPGGKPEYGENVSEALIREIKEETDLQVLIKGVAGTTVFEVSKYRVIALIMDAVTESSDVKISDEHEEHLWVPLEKAISMDLTAYFSDFLKINRNTMHN